MITFLQLVIISRSSYRWIFHMLVITAAAPSNLSTRGSVARAPVCSAGATLVTSISREVARERQVKGKARERARALTTPLTALPLASTISRGSHRLSWNGDLARRVLFSKLTSELTVSRDLKIRRRRRQRGRQRAIGLITKITIFHVHHAFLYISLPSLHDYDVKMPNFTFHRGSTQATTKFPLSLSELGYGP